MVLTDRNRARVRTEGRYRKLPVHSLIGRVIPRTFNGSARDAALRDAAIATAGLQYRADVVHGR